jgi:hypothetical protein
MSRPGGRLPGDVPDGDARFGPLGGLPDQVHYYVRAQEREADAAGERLARGDGGTRPDGRRGLTQGVRGVIDRVTRFVRTRA